jgi:hypothetical protein
MWFGVSLGPLTTTSETQPVPRQPAGADENTSCPSSRLAHGVRIV